MLISWAPSSFYNGRLELVCGKRVDESSVASKINLSTLGK